MGNKVDYDKMICHLKDGYQNAQATIKFIDTKTNIIFGLCSTSLAIIMSSVIRKGNLLNNMQIATMLDLWLYIFAGLFFVLIVFCCFGSCLLSLVPRKPPKSHVSVLCPFYFSEKEAKYLYKFCSEFNNDKIVNEYQEQLYIVGKIIVKKIKWNKCATKTFFVQLCLMLILLIKFF